MYSFDPKTNDTALVTSKHYFKKKVITFIECICKNNTHNQGFGGRKKIQIS